VSLLAAGVLIIFGAIALVSAAIIGVGTVLFLAARWLVRACLRAL